MKMKTQLLILLYFFTCLSLRGQDDGLFSRMQAISNNGIDFFNVDGMEMTSQKTDAAFGKNNITRVFKNFKIKDKELTQSDSTLGFPNYCVSKSVEEPKGVMNNLSYYFIESTDNKLIGITIASINKTDKEFERQFVRLIKDDAIPKSIYNSLQVDSINFAGRQIALGGSCHWMGVNNVQCHYYGQMNWSVHKTLVDASQSVNDQFIRIKDGNKGKIVSDTTVAVIFEGTETYAKKIIYDFTGVTSVLVGMSGGKTLTVYFVSAPVRNNFVSCVMSFWNNDQINPGGLSPLLEKVMKLK